MYIFSVVIIIRVNIVVTIAINHYWFFFSNLLRHKPTAVKSKLKVRPPFVLEF